MPPARFIAPFVGEQALRRERVFHLLNEARDEVIVVSEYSRGQPVLLDPRHDGVARVGLVSERAVSPSVELSYGSAGAAGCCGSWRHICLTIWPARVGGDAVRFGVWLGGVNGLTCEHNIGADQGGAWVEQHPLRELAPQHGIRQGVYGEVGCSVFLSSPAT